MRVRKDNAERFHPFLHASLSFPIMSRFQMPTEPKNGLDLLRWTIFEPIFLEKFSATLSKRKVLYWFLKACPYIIISAVILWLTAIFIFVVSNIPSRIPEVYTPMFFTKWNQYPDMFFRYVFIIKESIFKVFITLVGGFCILLGFWLILPPRLFFIWLGMGLGIELGIGIGFGIGFSNGFNSIMGFSPVEIMLSLLAGILCTVFIGGDQDGISDFFRRRLGLILIYIISIISFSLDYIVFRKFGMQNFSFVGIGFLSLFFLMKCRIPLYFCHIIYSIFANDLERNSYLKDGQILIPLWLVNRKLIRLAQQQPAIAFDLAEFFLEYRPLQTQLVAQILHAASSGAWQQQAINLNAGVLIAPSLPENQKKLHPSENWITNVEHLRTQLINSQTQTQVTLKKEAFEQFFEMLTAFRLQTLVESRRWNRFYLDAIDVWLKVSAEYLDTLKQQAQLLEPMASNLYKSGEALQAQLDDRIFVGRDDLKDTLSFEILTARQMPLFLIQGQRRVGKTSLLNFLPLLLGARFKIVSYDLQGLEDRTLGGFFFALRNTINKAFSIQEEAAWNPPGDWLRAWGEFREYVAQLVNGKDFKLVLAFDEYEILHDDIFQRDPQQAARLLGVMRSFSQQQNQVVFLFVGARFFSELQQPNWNEYFVQVKHLRVDYLKRPDVLHLIQHPTPDFGLIYADDLANRIFDLTQGHPALVQQICSEMVNLANMTNHRQMTHEDLNQVLAEKTLFRENLTIQIFWTQFCAPAERATVKQILAGETPTDPVSRSRLELHGYIVKDGDGWKMRVPLFEQWLRKYIETFPA